MKIVKTVLKVVFAAIFVLSGCVHFFDPGFYLKIMPDYIASSLHLPAVYVSGAAEIMLGILLLIPRTTRLAGWGLIAVFPANISAYQHSREIFPDLDPALHFWRLPLQGTIIAWAYQYTRPKRPTVQQSKEAVG